jgi:hypothetical protein
VIPADDCSPPRSGRSPVPWLSPWPRCLSERPSRRILKAEMVTGFWRNGCGSAGPNPTCGIATTRPASRPTRPWDRRVLVQLHPRRDRRPYRTGHAERAARHVEKLWTLHAPRVRGRRSLRTRRVLSDTRNEHESVAAWMSIAAYLKVRMRITRVVAARAWLYRAPGAPSPPLVRMSFDTSSAHCEVRTNVWRSVCGPLFCSPARRAVRRTKP